MKISLLTRCLAATPVLFELLVYRRSASGGPPSLLAGPSPALHIKSARAHHPGEEQELLFEWPLVGLPSDYVFRLPMEKSRKFQYRRFTCDGVSLIAGADEVTGLLPVTEGGME